MKRKELNDLVSKAGCTLTVDSYDVGWEVLIQPPCGFAFSGGGGVHELVTGFYSDREAMYAEAASELLAVLPLEECPDDCEWCYAPEE